MSGVFGVGENFEGSLNCTLGDPNYLGAFDVMLKVAAQVNQSCPSFFFRPFQLLNSSLVNTTGWSSFDLDCTKWLGSGTLPSLVLSLSGSRWNILSAENISACSSEFINTVSRQFNSRCHEINPWVLAADALIGTVVLGFVGRCFYQAVKKRCQQVSFQPQRSASTSGSTAFHSLNRVSAGTGESINEKTRLLSV